MGWKVENDFEHNGLRCVAIFTSMGHRCGYVGVSASHPLYGKDYSDKCSILKKSDIENQEIGKRGIIPLMCMDTESENISPECYFDVHGGITYAGGGENSKYPVESNLWWFGFDCAHCGDAHDIMKAVEYGLMEEERAKSLKKVDDMYPIYGDEIRSQDYVEQ
jgi:hypothetical protein